MRKPRCYPVRSAARSRCSSGSSASSTTTPPLAKPTRSGPPNGRSSSPIRELLRFRHFKRYYFEFEYDWDRLDFLRKKLAEARRTVRPEIETFLSALETIAGEAGGPS